MTRYVHVMARYRRGGGEQRFRDMTAAFPDDDHVLVVGERVGTIPDRTRVIDLPSLVRRIDPSNDVRTVGALRRCFLARSSDPGRPLDVVVVSHYSKSHLLAGLALLSIPVRRRPPLVVSLSMSPTNEPGGDGFWAVQRYLDRRVRPRVLAVGEEVAKEYRDRTASTSIEIIRTSMDLEPFFTAGSAVSRKAPADELTVLFVGSLEERKGILSLPEVTALVTRHVGRPVRMVFAGDGELRETMFNITWSSAVSLVMLGHRTDIADIMASADVLVLPSRSEGLPQVLVQAAAAGLPFATTPVTGAAEVLGRGATGVMARSFGVDDIAEALLKALELPRGQPSADWIEMWKAATVEQRYREVLG